MAAMRPVDEVGGSEEALQERSDQRAVDAAPQQLLTSSVKHHSAYLKQRSTCPSVKLQRELQGCTNLGKTPFELL